MDFNIFYSLHFLTDDKGIKILAVDPNTYKFLLKKSAEDEKNNLFKNSIKRESGLNNNALENTNSLANAVNVKTEPSDNENNCIDTSHQIKKEIADNSSVDIKPAIKEEQDDKGG